MKPVWGCVLCKRNRPHQHEKPPQPIPQARPFSKVRAMLLMKAVQETFFKNYRGRWYTVRLINEKETT